jgi:hypothetical protein
MYNLTVQPWNVETREFLSGRTMQVVRFIGTLPSGDKQAEVKTPESGFKYYVLKDDLPKSESKPWYQVLGKGTFKGVGLGLEFSKLPKTIQYLIYLAIALAIRWVFKKYKK